MDAVYVCQLVIVCLIGIVRTVCVTMEQALVRPYS